MQQKLEYISARTNGFVPFVNSRGPSESDTIIKESGYTYSDTYKWEKKEKK